MLVMVVAAVVAVAVTFVILSSLIIVPAYHFGVAELFGERTGRIIREGLGFKMPFFETVELISLELERTEVKAKFTTAPPDRLALVIKGSLQYKPDPDVDELDEHGNHTGRNVFISISEEIIAAGITEAVQSVLGNIGGVTPSDGFIRNRRAVESLINCFLRLGVPPHLNHAPGDAHTCGQERCRYPQGRIPAKQVLRFYDNHTEGIRRILGREQQEPEVRSDIENRYGIDITTFAAAEIDFSEDVQRSFEKRREAQARKEAFGFKMQMARRVKDDLDADAQVALNAADVSLDPAVKKQVVSVEGSAGVIGGFLGLLAGEKGGK